jgi:transglutaminase-like putative cysteine protease
MPMESSGANAGGTTNPSPVGSPVPWSCVTFGPPPSWVEEPAFERNLTAKEGAHVSALLWERQVNVEAEASFHATALRLETPLAVQHQSQWRLNLDPRFHHLTLHWLRVVRDGRPIDQLQRERMRLIQREAQLDNLVIDGLWTLLVVFDDVRPGDTIEAGYSFSGRHPIRPGGCETFFTVPANLVVGRFRLRVEFDASRPGMGWLASPDAPNRREESLPDGRIRWIWEDRQTTPREAEPNPTSTFLDFIWVQVSDLPEWQPLISRLAEVWNRASDDSDLGQLPGLARSAEVNEEAVVGLVRHLQDEFRYLSVDLESGGWIPMAPVVVARRRYGDCKDLAWLATSVLRGWGVTARPVLVGTGLRERVETLRPMSALFNHAVLEVEIAGKTRWFDLTLRHQGGDFTSLAVPQYGRGLPVDAAASALREQPGPPPAGLYALRETILLDTRRTEVSTVELRVWAEGWHADNLRAARGAKGPDEFEKERLAQTRRRYGKAERAGTLQWRDDRVRNVCELVEAFEVRDIVAPDEQGKRAWFDVPANLMLQSFALPEEKPRRGPWGMPPVSEIRHEITIRARSMSARPSNRWRWVQPEFTATLDHPLNAGAWTKIIRFAIHASEISVERLPAYRRELNEFLRATTWRLYLPWDQARPHRDETFGQLPPVTEGVAAYVQPADLRVFADAPPNLADALKTAKPWTARHRTFNIPYFPANMWRFALPAFIFLTFLIKGCMGPGY